MKTKNYLLLFVITFSIFAFVSIADRPVALAKTNDALSDILSRGYLIVGSDNDYAPFESINVTSGFAHGFDVMIAHQIALDLGVGLNFKTATWPPFDALNLGDFDISVNGITVTATRDLIVDFSRWYYKSSQGMLVEAGNPLGITTEADLNVSTLTIGVQQGTTSDIYTADQNLTATVSTFAQFSLAIEALKLGAVDVVLGDIAVLELDAAQSGKTEVVATFSPEEFGIAVPGEAGSIDSASLLVEINKTINRLLGSDPNNPDPNSLYNAMYFHWFGVSFLPQYTGFQFGSVTVGRAPLYDNSGTLVTNPPANITVTIPPDPVTIIQTITQAAVTISTTEVSTVTQSVPGFEFLGFLVFLAVIPVIRKYRK